MPITINGSGTVSGLSVGGLPDGSIASADLAAGVGGKVLQCLSTSTSTDVNATDENTWTDSGLSQAITMTSSSNKVLVMSHLYIYIYGNGELGGYSRVLRGTTDLGKRSAFFPLNSSGSDDSQAQIVLDIFDTPGAGTHTYKVQGRPYSSASDLTIHGGGDMYSTLTLLEIAA